MSFLDESSATLQEALAFIDACESSKESTSVSAAARRKPRKSPKPGYWERIRAEGDSLREQAAALETTLKQLQAQAASHVDRSPWMLVERNDCDEASRRTQEHQQRLKAESANQRLKGLIAKNIVAIETLTTLSFQKVKGHSPILSALLDRANRLASNALATLERVRLTRTDSFLFRTQREVDAQLGSTVESVSSTPLIINRQQADVALWRRFMLDVEHASGLPAYAKFVDGGFTKAYPSTFAFGGERFKLTSHMLLQRHVRENIVIYVWTASTLIPTTNIKFIEESLISVRNPTPDTAQAAQRAALLQCWYRIHAEECGVPGSGMGSMDLELLKENAMRLRSNMGMSYLQSLENLLMDEANGESTTTMAPTCTAAVQI